MMLTCRLHIFIKICSSTFTYVFFPAFTGGVYVHKVSHQLMKMRFTPCLLLSDYLKRLLFFIQYPRDRPSLDPAAVLI